MGERTGIEWTDSTWNPIRARNLATGKIGWHCEHVSEGCRNCYAESINLRLGTGLPFKPGHRGDYGIVLDEKMLLYPLRWKKPRRVFVNSMSDTFAEFVKDEWIDRMFAVMALCPDHTFQVLTKRPERMLDYMSANNFMKIAGFLPVTTRWIANAVEIDKQRLIANRGETFPLPNVWLGTSAEDQAAADERIPLLLQTPAAVRFVSLEPLLGPIKLADAIMPWVFDELRRRIINDKQPNPRDGKLDWVIVGGESGPNARPMHPEWARDIRDQCAAAGLPYFFKQWGAFSYVDAIGVPSIVPRRVGKHTAGRLLDGIEHNGMPS